MSDVEPHPDPSEPQIALPGYHQQLLSYLQQEHGELWNWFDSNPVRSRHTDSVRLALLRTAYRLDRASSESIYRVADDVADTMQMAAPVVLYQAQNPQDRNASLAWLPDEAHVILHGNLQELLTESELSAVIAHELAHHQLYTVNASAFLTVEQVLQAMLDDRSGSAPHDRTWRSFQLYTELYCDRRALQITGSLDDVVSALVKLDTGVKDISATAYLDQAQEILSTDPQENATLTHPEMYIRAWGLAAWQKDPTTADAVIRPLIEGTLQLERLDLLQQAQLSRLTESFLHDFLQPAWLRTRVTEGHLRRFFPNATWDASPADTVTGSTLTLQDVRHDPQLLRYLCCLLLDFVTVDPQLEDAPLAAAFLFADKHNLSEPFESLAKEELRLGKRHFRRIRSQAEELVATAHQELTE